MKKALFLFLLCLASLNGEIFETPHFSDIHSHLKPGTLVILDIDDTLLIPVQMLGCDEWFQHCVRCHKKAGKSASDCIEQSLYQWQAVRHLTKMEIVEPGTDRIVRQLQKEGYQVMGLTTQGMDLAMRTRRHLLDHDIDLTLTSPLSKDHYQVIGKEGVLFRAGVLYTSGAHKGEALFGLLEQLDSLPKRILFINDKRSPPSSY